MADKPFFRSPFFLPRLLIDKSISMEDYKRFIDKLTENEYGNALRFFSSSVTLPWTVEGNIHPYLKIKNKFNLHQISPTWINTLCDRIGYFVEKGGTPILTLIDGCSWHASEHHLNGWWRELWWNGLNNMNCTSQNPKSLYYIFKPRNNRERMSRHFILTYVKTLIRIMERKFPDSIVYDFNEVSAPAEWYLNMSNWLFDPFEVPKERKMFSYVADEDKAYLLKDRYIRQIHQIDSLQKYRSIDRRIFKKVAVSADGCNAMNKATVKRLAQEVIKIGDYGIENNRLRRKEQCGLNCHIDWELAKAMKEGYTNPNTKAIKTFEVKDGKFIINGKATKLCGVSKREMVAVGSGASLGYKINYTYDEIKSAILDSDINYVRYLIPLDIDFARQETEDYLAHGKLVEAELFDADKPSRPYQAHWKIAFEALKDLPVLFDAHNEFTDKAVQAKVVEIVEHVVSNGGIICAGAWSGAHGKAISTRFQSLCRSYQIKSHHREWEEESFRDSRESGKSLLWSELHSRDDEPDGIKHLLQKGFDWGAEGVQIYSLLNYGMGEGSKFQEILNFTSNFCKELNVSLNVTIQF